MKKLLYLILFLHLSAYAQEKNEGTMTTVFKKEIDSNVIIRQVRNGDSWIKTIVSERKSDKSIELENLEYSDESRRVAEKFGYLLPQDNDRILDACLLHEDLFILQAIAGELIVDRVQFYNDDSFKRDRYSLARVHILPSSGGEIHYRLKWKTDGNYLFFYVDGTHTGTASFMGCFDAASDRLSAYKFSDDPIRIKDESSLFADLDFDRDENSNVINEAIKNVFIEQDRIVENKQFQYLFSFDVSNYELLGQRTQGITYFFYKDDYPSGETKVMCYDHYESEWILDYYGVRVFRQK